MTTAPTRNDLTLDFFDRLIESQVGLDELLTSAADFAGTSVGIVYRDGTALARGRYDAVIDAVPPSDAVALQTGKGTTVWSDGPIRDDADTDFFLRRLAVAAQALSRMSASIDGPATATPLELLIRPGVSEPLMLESLRRLRLQPTDTVRVQLGEGDVSLWSAFLDSRLDRRLVARCGLSDLHVALWVVGASEGVGQPRPLAGLVVAESATFPARQVNDAFESARATLRFRSIVSLTTGQVGTLIRHEDLGPFAVLSELSREAIDAIPDVQALDRLARNHGADVLDVLESAAASESQRQAATRLHRHHTSVGYWIKRAEIELGFALNDPAQRARLFLAVVLHRLRDTATTLDALPPGADVRL